jgi:hypothetical protein
METLSQLAMLVLLIGLVIVAFPLIVWLAGLYIAFLVVVGVAGMFTSK